MIGTPMRENERYRRGAHTVTELKSPFVWKTKYGYLVLAGDIAWRARDIIRAIGTDHRFWIISGNVRANHVY